LPDFRGRVFVMADGGAGRMSSNDARGQTGGAERVTLSGAESGVAPHVHSSVRGLGFMASVGASPDAEFSLGSGYGFVADSTTAAAASAAASASHENMPPYQVGHTILIKT
jgi:microcystin-dependent protein